MREELPGTIYHHGIKGMHWGIRRTPEELGHPRREKRPRYDVSPRKLKKNQKYMTDQELQRAINRVNNQRQVAQMNPSAYRKTMRFMEQWKKDAGTIVAAAAASIVLYKKGKEYIDNAKVANDAFQTNVKDALESLDILANIQSI